jgi:hypothetical protein
VQAGPLPEPGGLDGLVQDGALALLDEAACHLTRRVDEPGLRVHRGPAVRDGHSRHEARGVAGTCNLDAWSLKRFMEIDLLVRSPALAAQFDERFAAISPLL